MDAHRADNAVRKETDAPEEKRTATVTLAKPSVEPEVGGHVQDGAANVVGRSLFFFFISLHLSELFSKTLCRRRLLQALTHAATLPVPCVSSLKGSLTLHVFGSAQFRLNGVERVRVLHKGRRVSCAYCSLE